MRRRLFTFASAVSLLLLLGFGALWGWTFFHAGSITWANRSMTFACTTDVDNEGICLMIEHDKHGPYLSRASDPGFATNISLSHPGVSLDDNNWRPHSTIAFRWHAFAYYRLGPPSFDEIEDCIQVPTWLPLVLSLPGPVMWMFRRRRARVRLRKGLCKVCGYDLRADSSGRCPECGTPISHVMAL